MLAVRKITWADASIYTAGVYYIYNTHTQLIVAPEGAVNNVFIDGFYIDLYVLFKLLVEKAKLNFVLCDLGTQD